MINPRNSGAIKTRRSLSSLAAEVHEARAQENWEFSMPDTLYTFLCKSGEHFILNTFVYITLGIDSQTDSLCTRKYEIRAAQSVFMLFYHTTNS